MEQSNYMIEVEEALQIIEQEVSELSIRQSVDLKDALGLVLADSVTSRINMPPFRQSAMDGYALRLHESDTYKVIGEVKAGSSTSYELKSGEAVRIFTGACVPDTADTVIMQEKTERKDELLICKEIAEKHANIRPEGDQIKKGAVALHQGEILTPAGVSFLQGLGVVEVIVKKPLSAAIVITGDELVDTSEKLSKGQIFESNGLMLQTALQGVKCQDTQIIRVKDDYEATISILEKAINAYDLVLISGGISVGEYDFSGKALLELGVEQKFYKVKQKPGKPLFFGKKEGTIIFSLPGNPAAALTCFYIYVLRAIHLAQGRKKLGLATVNLPLKKSYIKKGDRAQFLKANVSKEGVEILDHQSSAMLRSFARSNALVYIPIHKAECNAGELVEVYLL